MHVHMRVPFADGPLYLNDGITTVLSLGTRASTLHDIIQERDRSRTPHFMGPSLYSAGPWIRGRDSDTPDEVERIVRENAEGGFDFVKVHGDVSPEAFDRLQDTARRLGIKVTGHAQRSRGMQPAYKSQQDLAHIEEYLYASFNPDNAGFKTAVYTSLLVLFLSLIISARWSLGALSRRVRRRPSSETSTWSRPVRRWIRIFASAAWLFFIVLYLSVTEPFAGIYAGKSAAVTAVGILMLLVVVAAIVLTLRVLREWRQSAGTVKRPAHLIVVVGLAWTFVVCAGYLTPRSWRTTDAALEQIAQETAAAGIWVTPTLVVLDYMKRQNSDEFFTLNQRPGMRYLRPETRSRWIHENWFRAPTPPIQFAIWQNWTDLLSQLVGKLHAANVPLLAGSDAVGPPGVLPGSSLGEELSLLVRAGLTPYEALRTATTNPAIYLEAEREFGKIAPGFRADLVLLSGNPLDDIDNVQTRVGVMKRGRWFSANELESALARLAEERK
jgi:hypothetical protein